MKLIIDIPEEDRKDIGNVHFVREDLKFKIGKAIMNGTPLDDVKAENKGEWIADVDKWGDVVTTVNGYTCSKCGAFNSDKDNFCPNCGADMRGE